MNKLLIGLAAVAFLTVAGLVSTQAKAAPMVPAASQVKPLSLIEDVAWRRRYVRRPYAGRRAYVRGPVVRGPVVRRPVRRTLRRATRPWRW